MERTRARRIATSDPGVVLIPIPAPPRFEWEVPVEMVLKCPSSSVCASILLKRAMSGDMPLPTAKIYLRGDRFFAEVFFPGPNRPGVFLPLDLWKAVRV